MSDEIFHKVMDFVLKWEGASLVDNPNDPGGLTKYGIAIKRHPDLDRQAIINLTKEAAEAIYRRDYWQEIGGDSLTWPLSLIAMDTAVNCGVDKALQLLVQSEHEPRRYLALRVNHYFNLIQKNPKLEHFKKGWINRINDLAEEAGL